MLQQIIYVIGLAAVCGVVALVVVYGLHWVSEDDARRGLIVSLAVVVILTLGVAAGAVWRLR